MQPQLKSEKIPWHLIIIFLILFIAMWTGGFFYYKHEKERLRQEVQKDLTIIADLKVKQITDWRNERLGDATAIFNNHLIIKEIHEWFRNQSSVYKREILEWLTTLQKVYGYENILLIDANGIMRLSVHDEKELIGPETKRLIAGAMKSRKIIFSDLYKSKVSNAIRLGLYVPIIPHDKERIPIGLIILRIDPYKFLYPLIQSWPTPSKTAETVLLRKKGNEVLYLNELRHKKYAALSFKVSITEKHLPAVAAIQGYQGIFEGKDYRGVPVLAVIRAIPDTPWFLKAKKDYEEVYIPIREKFWVIALIVTVLIISSGTSLGFIWRHQRADFYRRQYELEHQHSALLKRFEYLTRHANDIILLADENYRIVEANQRAVQSYGYERDELLQLQLNNLHTPEARELLDAQMEEVKTRNGFLFETRHQRKDGTTFPVEVSSRAIDIEGKEFYQYIIRDITERKKAEEELKVKGQLLDNAIDSIFVIDLEGNFIYLNEAAYKTRGYNRDELMMIKLRELDDPKFAPFISKRFQEIMEKGSAIFESAHLRKDGSSMPIEVHSRVFEMGRRKFIFAVIRDITERKKAEEGLRRVNRALRTISECNKALVHSTDEQTLLNEICKVIVTIGGYSLAWVGYAEHDEQKTVRPVAYAGHEEGFLEGLHVTWADTEYGRGPSGTAICTNRPAVFNDISTDHGLAPWREDALKRGYASVIGLPLIINSDSIGVITICAGEFDAFHDDEVKLLTELSNDLAYGIAALRIRKEHQHFEEALQESEEKFKSAFNYAAIGKALVGIDGRWLQVNKALCNIVGYSEQELLSRTFQDITYPDDLDADLGYVRKMLAGEIQTYQMEKRYFHKLGHIIWVLLSVSVVCDQDENPLYFISQIQDISARKRAEEQLRIYRDNLEKTVKDRTADLEHTAEELKLQKNEAYISKFQAEAATRAKSDFLANMSHELRTPLNSVIGFSEILQDEMYGTLNEKQKEYLSDILSSGQHLLNLINDILDLSKVEAGKMELELSRFTLSDVLNTAMTMLKEKAIKHMIRLNLEIQPDAVMEIEADERKLKQIMFNLMSNAVKFTLDGGSVHVHARKVRSQEVGVKKKSPNSELNTPNTTEIS